MTEGLKEPFSAMEIRDSFATNPQTQQSRPVTDMYGPGRPLSAVKARQVSSTRTGPPTWLNASVYQLQHYSLNACVSHTRSTARRHLSLEMSSMVPWISTRSNERLLNGTMSPRMACTSASLLLLPVMKFNSSGGIIAAGRLARVAVDSKQIPK